MDPPPPPPPPPPPLPPSSSSSSSSSSFVSRAKTAFHTAASKVIKDIKTDLKTDHHHRHRHTDEETQSLKDEKKNAVFDSDKSESECHKPKNSRWRLTYHGKTKDQKKSHTRTDKKEKAIEMENTNEITPQYQENDLIEKEMQSSAPERSHNEKDEDSTVYKMDYSPSAPVIKQLALILESVKNWNSMRDLLVSSRDTLLATERTGLSFLVVKSLVLRDKEKSTSENNNEAIEPSISILFNSEDTFSRSSSIDFHAHCLSRDIHGAPPKSFVVRLACIIGSLKSLQKVASFWSNVLTELRRLWSLGQTIPHIPLDEKPDLNSCLLHQQLQVINCCIARKRRRAASVELLNTLLSSSNTTVFSEGLPEVSCSQIYARNGAGDLILRLGTDHPSEGLTMLETDEPIYSPLTQEGPILTEEFIRESEEFILRTGSLGAGCSQLLSDMQAFKAANPGCILEDFIRWYSPPDWTDADPDEANVSYDEEDSSLRRGRLSRRMQKEGNLWRELWETARPLPAVKQAPLYDEDLAVESIFIALDDISPLDLFEQLFVSALSAGIVIAEASLCSDTNLCKWFNDCKDYLLVTCQSGISDDNIKDMCKVYKNIEMITRHPEEASEVFVQSGQTNSGEKKNMFKIFSMSFSGKDKQLSETAPSEDEKKLEVKGSNVLLNLFDGKASLFSRNNSKSSTSAYGEQLCDNEIDWTIV